MLLSAAAAQKAKPLALVKQTNAEQEEARPKNKKMFIHGKVFVWGKDNDKNKCKKNNKR